MKLQKGDEVLVTTGKDRGKTAKIERILPDTGAVVLPKINMYKRHRKRRDERTPAAIVDFVRPLPVSNVALICPKCKKPTRIGIQRQADKKQRVCRKCHQVL